MTTGAKAGRPVTLPFDADLDQRSAASAEAAALDRIAPREVVKLLEVLPADQREVLALRLVAGLSVDQSAEVMGRSAGSVKQLQRRALLKLREATDVKEYLKP